MDLSTTQEKTYEDLHVLIADDMSFMRTFVRGCLEINFPGCVCTDASNGKTAMELLQAKPFSIVLCDWEMPDIKGDEILRWVREESTSKDMPFIMITANNDKECIMKVVALKITDYMVKPLNCDMLTQKILRALKEKAGGN